MNCIASSNTVFRFQKILAYLELVVLFVFCSISFFIARVPLVAGLDSDGTLLFAEDFSSGGDDNAALSFIGILCIPCAICSVLKLLFKKRIFSVFKTIFYLVALSFAVLDFLFMIDYADFFLCLRYGEKILQFWIFLGIVLCPIKVVQIVSAISHIPPAIAVKNSALHKSSFRSS